MGRFPTSPGPIYQLPPTIGFKDHDYRKNRAPAYSMSPRYGGGYGRDQQTPGPQYQIRGFTEHGKESPPAYSIVPRSKHALPFSGPGPGAHSPDYTRTKNKLPVWTMSPRNNCTNESIGPGPIAYSLPTTMGPKVPNMHVNGAYTMSPRLDTVSKGIGPGPAGYPETELNVYKNKLPKYTMSPRLNFQNKGVSPGPAAYSIQLGKAGPHYSMGRQLGEPFSPYITPEDFVPCAEPGKSK